MIGRADIEGSKSNVAMNAWPPQASYPCDVPPQSNSPPGSVLEPDHAGVVRRRALPPRRHSARLERNTVRPPIKSTAHRFRPTE
ncbi:unnamed protein product [Parnassius mnemosyne]|uniref:Uncharacterized protein n=1 Tax=Parnassius mnemosyne TaxID=213953 RepID=A0AAV1LVB2_9NEOP